MAAESQTFWFKSRRADTGLTDVVISIKNDAGAAQVTGASMTHAAFGNYYYVFTTTTSDTYIAEMSSASERTTSTERAVISTTTTTATTASQFATTLEIFEYLNWVKRVPDYPDSNTIETVDSTGTLANGSKIYLDNIRVIDGTQTISYGSDASSVTALTETTDYTIDNEIGEITLTAAGASNVGTASVFGSYKYNKFIDDSTVSDMIDRASRQLMTETHQTWNSLTRIDREEQPGRGANSTLYHPRNLPVHVVKTQLSGTISAVATTITVDSTTGLEAADILTIDSEQIQVTTVDDATTLTVVRGQNGTGTADHADDEWVVNAAVEISNTRKGGEPNFNTLAVREKWDIDDLTGAIQLLFVNSDDKDDLSADVFPLHKIFNRIRMTYKYGTSTVPVDVVRLTILMVVRDLMTSAIGRGITEGIDGFDPRADDKINAEIERIKGNYKRLKLDGF